MFKTNIPIYGLIIIITIFSGLVVIYKNLKKENFENEKIIVLILYIIIGAILGGKYFSFATNFKKFNGIFSFNKIGLSSYGAIIGIIIMLIIFSKQFKINLKKIMYVTMPSIPLIYGMGKIGCFISGCCYGIKYSGPFKIIYKYSLSAPNGISLFPVQLLEAIVFIIIFIVIQALNKKSKNKNNIIELVFITCGIAKFLLDYLRHTISHNLLSINQIFSLLFIIIGIFIILKSKKQNNK